MVGGGMPATLPPGDTTHATVDGMTRARISTTVDRNTLATARELVPGPDSRLVDEALRALIESRLAETEAAALALHPYDEDPDLAWHAPRGLLLPYDGPVPEDVLALARQPEPR